MLWSSDVGRVYDVPDFSRFTYWVARSLFTVHPGVIQKIEEQKMRCLMRIVCVTVALIPMSAANVHALSGPFDGKTFQGRIAYSADGNFNDPDDWAASPVALAIFAEAGVKDRLVHFDYNCIVPKTDAEWEKTHSESVLGTAKLYGYDLSLFHDCQQDLDGAVTSITRAIDASSADNPLYFILAGPMEVPYLGIQKSDPRKRKFVYCISHSRWNDGFSSALRHGFFTCNKRHVIDSGVNWVQIKDQNRLLSHSRYGRPAQPEEFQHYFWMRDSDDPKVRFLWTRMQISTRPDPSDAGMAYFLVTGDEQADPNKLKRLLNDSIVPIPIAARRQVRLEAENFVHLHGYKLEDRNDRNASHRLNVAPSGGSSMGRIRTRLAQPYTADQGRYDVDVRYFDGKGHRCRFALFVSGAAQGEAFESPGGGHGWTTHTIRNIEIRTGDEVTLEINGRARVDYVQLNHRALISDARDSASPVSVATAELDDPDALPGQIIVAGKNPGYLKYSGGGPAFLCGPDNPETFLFLGEVNPDGTRAGGQQQMVIDRLVKSGANAFHCQMFRMRRSNIKDEGDDQHCPFVDHDPKQPLNHAILDQWDGWISQLEKAGVIIHLEFYNDATDVEMMGWTLDENGHLHPDEKRMFEGIVKRFKHHKEDEIALYIHRTANGR